MPNKACVMGTYPYPHYCLYTSYSWAKAGIKGSLGRKSQTDSEINLNRLFNRFAELSKFFHVVHLPQGKFLIKICTRILKDLEMRAWIGTNNLCLRHHNNWFRLASMIG